MTSNMSSPTLESLAIDHCDQVEDEGEYKLVVKPKFSAAPGEEMPTPTYDPEFLLSNDQVLETIAKSGISQSSCRTFQLTPTRQDDSSLVVTLAAANPLMGTPERGYVTQVPCPYEDWGMMMVDQNLVSQCGEDS